MLKKIYFNPSKKRYVKLHTTKKITMNNKKVENLIRMHKLYSNKAYFLKLNFFFFELKSINKFKTIRCEKSIVKSQYFLFKKKKKTNL